MKAQRPGNRRAADGHWLDLPRLKPGNCLNSMWRGCGRWFWSSSASASSSRRMPRAEIGGLTLVLTGAIFLAHTYRVVRLHDSWPLFIVIAGLSVMFGSHNRKVEGKKP